MRTVYVLKVVVIVGGLYLLLVLAGYLGQRRLLYFPDPTRVAPSQTGLKDVAERIIATSDGETLIAWQGKARSGQPTLLYFHGNGGSVAGRATLIAKYMMRGRGVMMMSYRGYGGSSGSPSERANVADARLAFDSLLADGVRPQDIILYGESLGTGIAVQLAGERNVGGVILDSPYTSVVDRAAELYPFLPVGLILSDRYETSRHIAKLHAPLLIVHGEADEVIPVAMGRKLFALANEPKEIVTLPGAGHNDHDLYGSFEAINGWIDRLRSGAIKR